MNANDSRKLALLAYRNLLKAQRVTFKGDQYALKAAKRKTRQEFELNRKETIQEVISRILLEHVAQAKLSDQDKNIYSIFFNKELQTNPKQKLTSTVKACDTFEEGLTDKENKCCSEIQK